jgi:RimJ/RimL family protein N-acetyltransferase
LPAPARVSDGNTTLRRITPADAPAIARAVHESLNHLAAWMPWAGSASATESFQRQRLGPIATGYDDDTATWEFAICERVPGEDGRETELIVGLCGITVRDDGRREIGYWVHVDHTRRGHATRAAAMLTQMWREHRREPRIEIRCDAANRASAAIPKQLGYHLEGVIDVEPEARSETGKLMVWSLQRA